MITIPIESILLALIIWDCYLQYKYSSEMVFSLETFKYLANTNLSLIIVIMCLFFSILDMILFYTSVTRHLFRLSSFLRLILVVLYSKSLSHQFLFIANTIPEIWRILALQLLNTTFFAWFALIIFPSTSQEGATYFPNLLEALWSLVVLMTLSNSPDIFVSAYNSNRFAGLYFVVFLCISIYLLTNLLLAVVITAYHQQKHKAEQTEASNREANLKKAFSLMADERGLISLSSFTQVMRELGMSYLEAGHVREDNIEALFRLLDSSGDCKLDLAEFQALPDALHYKISKMAVRSFGGRWFPRLVSSPFFHTLKTIVSSKEYKRTMGVVLWSGLLLLAVQMLPEITGLESSSTGEWVVGGVNLETLLALVLSFVFAAEMAVKLLAKGWKSYWSNGITGFEGLVTVFSLCTSIYVLATWNFNLRLMRALLLIRFSTLSKIVFVRTEYKDFHKVLYSTVPLQLAATLFCTLYCFSFLGLLLFGGKVCSDESSARYSAIADTAYASNNWWAFNFNDMGAGMFTLFVIIDVSSWHVIVEAYVRATGSKWCRLFFFAALVSGVWICLSVFEAFIISAFSARWMQKHSETEEERMADVAETKKSDQSEHAADSRSLSSGKSYASQVQMSKGWKDTAYERREELRLSLPSVTSMLQRGRKGQLAIGVQQIHTKKLLGTETSSDDEL